MSNPLLDPSDMVKFLQSLAYLRSNKPQWRGKRSTLSEDNAGEFRQYLEVLATSPADGVTILRREHRGVTLNTLYQKWMGALQWMIEDKKTTPDQKQVAALVKTAYHAIKDDQIGGLRIVPRTGKESTPRTVMQAANKILDKAESPKSEVWKSAFIEWLTSGEAGVPFIIKGLTLRADDIEFVRNICDQANIEHEVTFTTIKAMKP